MALGFNPTFGVGSGDRVDLPFATHGVLRTYSVWAYRLGTGENALGVLWAKNGSTNPDETAQIVSGVLTYTRRWSSAFGRWSVPLFGVHRWAHVVVTYDAGATANTPRIFLNGVEQVVTTAAAPSGTLITNTTVYSVGNRQATANVTWDGKLAEFAIWDRLLTAAEIAGLSIGEHPSRYRTGLAWYDPLGGPQEAIDVPAFHTRTGTRLQPHPFIPRRRVQLVPVALTPQFRTLTLGQTTDTPLPLTIPHVRMLGIATGTETPLPMTPLQGATPAVATFTDPFTASNGLLATTTAASYTALQGGTRWQVVGNQAAFVGSAFGAEQVRCNIPANSEAYAVRAVLGAWSRGGANDVSLGLIVRKDVTATLTYYVAFVSATASAALIQLWRYLNGTATQLQTAVVTAVTGQLLEVQVIPRTFPTTQLIVRLNGVPYLDVTDEAIPAGRYFGLHGYLQGTLSPAADLRLENLQMQVPQFLIRRRRGLAGLSALTGVR